MKSSKVMLFMQDLFTKYLATHYKPNVRVSLHDMRLTQSGEVVRVKNEK